MIEIDLDALEPWIVGPHSPDLARPVSQMGQDADGEGYDTRIRYGLIGSCTNSSYEDIGRAAHLAQQAMDAGLKTAIPLMVTPGSNRVMETIQRAGFMEIFDAVGATVLGLRDLAPEGTLRIEAKHADGTIDRFEVTHSLDAEQIEWFKAGSALNRIAARRL